MEAANTPGLGLRTRQLVFVSLVGWLLCAGVWAALLGLEHTFGCPPFQRADSAVFDGTERWQWLPPGESCTYRIAGQTHTDSPATARIAVLGLLLLWPVATFAFSQASKADVAVAARRA